MKKSIFKRIGLIALAVCVAIGSFFVPVTKKQYNSASAADDVTTSYTFTGSNIYIPFWRNLSAGNYFLDLGLYRNQFTTSSNGVNFSTLYSKVFFENHNSSSDNVNYFVYNIYSSYNSPSDYGHEFFYSFDNVGTYYPVTLSAVYDDRVVATYTMWIYCNSSDFIANIYKLTLTSSRIAVSGLDSYCNIITYYDVNDNYIQILFKNIEGSDPYKNFNNRTYFLNNDFSDSQIYNQGYQEGLADNQSNIYNNGYNAGYNIGFGNGKISGMAEANDFSFISLIGAVVDVPLQTFLGLFHFELLGINLANFILALLTVAFIIFVIKLLLGSK